MNLLKKICKIFTYEETLPLYYTDRLRESYNGRSVSGNQLNGKVAVVTGGYGGIGFAITQRLLSEGCKVIITGRSEEKLQRCVDNLCLSNLADVSFIVMDQNKPVDIRKATKMIFAQNKIDILVNCAGIFTEVDKNKRFRNVSKLEYFKVVNVNLKSMMLLSDLVACEMISFGTEGHIVNIASICGYSDKFGYTPYGISKSGVVALTKYLDLKYKGKLVINGIAPGSVATIMASKKIGDSISTRVSNILKHIAMPEEIAALAAFLSCDCGKNFGGETLVASAHEVL